MGPSALGQSSAMTQAVRPPARSSSTPPQAKQLTPVLSSEPVSTISAADRHQLPLPLPPRRRRIGLTEQPAEFQQTPPPIVPRIVLVDKSPEIEEEKTWCGQDILIDQADWMHVPLRSQSTPDFTPPPHDPLECIEEDRSEESSRHEDNTTSLQSDQGSSLHANSHRSSQELSVSGALTPSPALPQGQLQKLRAIHKFSTTQQPTSVHTSLSSCRVDRYQKRWRRFPNLQKHLRKLRRCCRPRVFLSYLFCLLIVILAILGTVFLSLGAMNRDRDFLVAGVILSISCLGLLLHHCWRRSPNNALKSAEDLSIYMPPIPLPLELSCDPSAPPAPGEELHTVKTSTETGSTNHESCGDPEKPALTPVQPLRLDVRRTSFYGEPSPMGIGCSRCSLFPPPRVQMRPPRCGGRRGSAMMDIARRLSVVGNSAPPMSNGWGDSNSGGDRHRFRRCSSHPWEMNRPENPYRE